MCREETAHSLTRDVARCDKDEIINLRIQGITEPATVF